jgi:cysteine-rich repeat protein
MKIEWIEWTWWTEWTAWTRTLAAAVAVSLVLIAGCSDDDSGQPFADCGNGQLDGGEQCDDGNTDDHDACLSTCVPARCGDLIVDRTTEQCDGSDLDRQTCGSLGRAEGTLVCQPECTFDISGCGAPLTPTPPPSTATPTPSPTPTTFDPCGDGLLAPDETCESCPADCQARACAPSQQTRAIEATFQPPAGLDASSTSLLVSYRSSALSLPGSGMDTTVRQRVSMTPSNTLVTVNDLGYALTVVMSRAAGIPAGRVAVVTFDTCTDAASPTEGDFACRVEGCAGRFGPIAGCNCRVTLP